MTQIRKTITHTAPIVISFAAMLLLSSVSAKDAMFRQSDPQYQASYNVDNSDPNAPIIHIQLELTNYDITNWFQYNQTAPIADNTTNAGNNTNGTNATNGSNTTNTSTNTQPLPGVLMGIGLGSQSFGNSDLIVCNFTQDLNLSKNGFDCFDYYVDENGTVTLDQQQDVRAIFTQYPFPSRIVTTNIETTNPDTNETNTTTVNNTKADFIVSFVRSLNTNDSTGDFTLQEKVVDAYWVFGPIFGNELNITEHLQNANDFGTTQFDLTPDNNGTLQSGNNDNNSGSQQPSSGAVQVIASSCVMIASALAMVLFQ